MVLRQDSAMAVMVASLARKVFAAFGPAKLEQYRPLLACTTIGSEMSIHYTSEVNFQLGSIGVEEVDCNNLNLSYVRVNSPKLVSYVHGELDSFIRDIRLSIEGVAIPQFYSPPPVTLLSYCGAPLLRAKIDLEFYQKKKRSWPLPDYQIPWEIWQLQLAIVRIKEREYWERMREELADSVSEVVLKTCSLINRPQFVPQMPTRSDVANVFDTTYPECQPYLMRIVRHPHDTSISYSSFFINFLRRKKGQGEPFLFGVFMQHFATDHMSSFSGKNSENTLMTVGASAVKKMLRDTFLS
ncbi:unnamed protein product [Gongylonema pulchrum]|uniref:Autophagy-related protein 101 n=1 Tax=Gongylonema pulchrum TaxID=637853 RepID=A0A183EE70_9BILA|nr:unnamed protein product [Gongylonema pulchrum]